jgi:hypothetical protein
MKMIIKRVSIAMSLVAAIAVGVVWINSYRWEDRWRRHSWDELLWQFSTINVSSGRGLLLLEEYSYYPPPSSKTQFRRQTGSRDLGPGTNGQAVWQHSRETLERVPQWTPPFHPHAYGYQTNVRPPVNDQLRFHWVDLWVNDGSQHHWRGVALPYWILFVLAMLLPVILFVLGMREKLRRRRRASLGLCMHCGYDLRATSRCPECGRAQVTTKEPP